MRATCTRVIIFPSLSVITREVFRSWKLPFFLIGTPLSVVRVWLILQQENIELVHTNTGVIVSSGPAAWLAGVPHV